MARGKSRSVTGKQRLDFAALNRGIKRKASASSVSNSDTDTPEFSQVLTMDTDEEAGSQFDGTDQRQESIPYQAVDPDELERQLSRLAEAEQTILDEDEVEAEFEARYKRITLPSEDPENPLNTPEHYEPIIKHCEQRLKHHSQQALHYVYEIIRYRKLAGLASNPSKAGDNVGDNGKLRQQAQDGMADRKWKLCEVRETEVAMKRKFRTSLSYDELLHLMFAKEDWEGETDLDKLIDDEDDAEEGTEKLEPNHLDELD